MILTFVDHVEDIKDEEGVSTKPKHLFVTFSERNALAMEITYKGAAQLAAKINRHLFSREQPLGNSTTLPAGNNVLLQRAEEFKVTIMDDAVCPVQLHATLGVHPGLSDAPEERPAATTLAIRMDQTAAIGLLRQLRDLAQKMGWPLP